MSRQPLARLFHITTLKRFVYGELSFPLCPSNLTRRAFSSKNTRIDRSRSKGEKVMNKGGNEHREIGWDHANRHKTCAAHVERDTEARTRLQVQDSMR